MSNDEQSRVIAPGAFTVAAVIFAGLLIHRAAAVEAGELLLQSEIGGGRRVAMTAGLQGIAEIFGLYGSIGLSAVLVLGMSAWLGLTWRRIVKARGGTLG